MTPFVAVLSLAVIAHVLGWVLPVVDEYVGWQAFRVALSPLWPFESFRIDPTHLIVLSVSSALTNAAFAVVAIALLTSGPRQRYATARAAMWVSLAAAGLNLHWPISMGEERAELEVGYYVWVASFLLLALAAHLRARSAVARGSRL